jgi:hypothetical protein
VLAAVNCLPFVGVFVLPVPVFVGPAPCAPGFRAATAAGPAQPIRSDFPPAWLKRIADASTADRDMEGKLAPGDCVSIPGFVSVKACDPLWPTVTPEKICGTLLGFGQP